MKVDIKVPSFGESVSEAVVANILKQSGEHVVADEPIVELETDKVSAEVPAPAAGVVNLTVSVDDVLTTEQVIGYIDTEGVLRSNSSKRG